MATEIYMAEAQHQAQADWKVDNADNKDKRTSGQADTRTGGHRELDKRASGQPDSNCIKGQVSERTTGQRNGRESG